jgi:hypothetical protein
MRVKKMANFDKNKNTSEAQDKKARGEERGTSMDTCSGAALDIASSIKSPAKNFRRPLDLPISSKKLNKADEWRARA